MKIEIHPHARQRMRERGATVAHVREAVMKGTPSPAKYGRSIFTRTFPFGKTWNGKRYARQKIEAFAAKNTRAVGWS
jgi:hypothetical protein